MHIILFCFFLGLFYASSNESWAQELKKETYLWFDDQIGQTNSGVFKGVLYVNEYRVVNEKHQFFESLDFRFGSISYKGQSYFNIPLKYDIYLDQLLLQNQELANEPIMVCDTKAVTEFTIDSHPFRYIEYNIGNREVTGFFELLLKNDYLSLYKKHTRKIFKRTDDQSIYYEFKSGYYYVLRLNDAYYPFKKATQLSTIFPAYKKELKSIGKRHSSIKKTDSDNYIREILTDLLVLIPTDKPEEL